MSALLLRTGSSGVQVHELDEGRGGGARCEASGRTQATSQQSRGLGPGLPRTLNPAEPRLFLCAPAAGVQDVALLQA